MIDIPTLSEAFASERAHQAELHGRTLTPFDNAIGQVLFAAAENAIAAVANADHSLTFNVMPAPTGSGKTMSALALLSAGFKSHPTFSGAYVVESIRQAEEMRVALSSLVSEQNVCCWTSGHDAGRNEVEIAKEYGFLPPITRQRDEIAKARLVIITHRLWMNEIDSGKNYGARTCRGQRRDVVFVDELPALVTPIVRTGADILEIHDRLRMVDEENAWLRPLREACTAIHKLILTKGVRFEAKERIIDPATVQPWAGLTYKELFAITDRGLDKEKRLAQATRFHETIDFMLACAAGMGFVCRAPACVVGYLSTVNPGAGHVLLDATADLCRFTSISPWALSIEVPQVSYAGLKAYHIDHPKQFSNVSKVTEKAVTGHAYGEWIAEEIIKHTEVGDAVLLVSHKKMFDYEFLPAGHEDPSSPWLLEGRNVTTIHWGGGIGSNKWRTFKRVFMFGEFHRPARVGVAVAHGWSAEPPNNAALRLANTREVQGVYKDVRDGHLLRWLKQEATRGCCRTIDAHGTAEAMELYTSADLGRLLTYWPELFPDAPPPTLIDGDGPRQRTGPEKVVRLLADPDRFELPSGEIQRVASVGPKKVTKLVKDERVATAAKRYGWEYRSGKGGRGNQAGFVKP